MFDFLDNIRQNLQVPWRRGLFEGGIGLLQGGGTQGALDGFNQGLLAARQKPSTKEEDSSGWQGLLGNALQEYKTQQAKDQSEFEQFGRDSKARFDEQMGIHSQLSGPRPGLPVRPRYDYLDGWFRK